MLLLLIIKCTPRYKKHSDFFSIFVIKSVSSKSSYHALQETPSQTRLKKPNEIVNSIVISHIVCAQWFERPCRHLDASLQGSGADMDHLSTSGQLSEELARQHMNRLELLTVLQAVQCWNRHVVNDIVLFTQWHTISTQCATEARARHHSDATNVGDGPLSNNHIDGMPTSSQAVSTDVLISLRPQCCIPDPSVF